MTFATEDQALEQIKFVFGECGNITREPCSLSDLRPTLEVHVQECEFVIVPIDENEVELIVI